MFEQLSVFKNLELALALKTHQGVPSSLFFRIDSAQQDRLAEVLHTIHLAASVRRMAGMADEETETIVYIGEREQLGYLSGSAQDALNW